MDWTTIVALGLFVAACVLAVYQSRKENWATNLKLGRAILLIGAAVGLFLDDIITTNSPVYPWAEPIGASIMIVGLLVSYLWQPE